MQLIACQTQMITFSLCLLSISPADFKIEMKLGARIFKDFSVSELQNDICLHYSKHSIGKIKNQSDLLEIF